MSLLDSIKQTVDHIKQKTRHRFDLTRPPAEWVNYYAKRILEARSTHSRKHLWQRRHLRTKQENKMVWVGQ